MAKNIELNVSVRERTGKGGAREARRNGMIPGVLYGGGDAPIAISLKTNELTKAINSGKFRGNAVTLVHDGQKQMVIPQDVQFHPVNDRPLHVDLYRVKSDQIISVEVPVRFVGEEESPGLKQGGTLNVVRYAVELNVAAGSIPESLTADISTLEIGDNVKISDIDLPSGAEPTITDRDFTIATIVASRAAIEEDTEEYGEDVAAGDVPASEQSEDAAEGEG